VETPGKGSQPAFQRHFVGEREKIPIFGLLAIEVREKTSLIGLLRVQGAEKMRMGAYSQRE